MKKLAPIKSQSQKVGLGSLSPIQVKVADRGKGLQLYIPPDLYKALKAAAFDRDTTIRAVVLAALKKDGFNVKSEDLKDRRTSGEV
jgi:hypothetical protein